MIGLLRGRVLQGLAESSLVIDVGGVGYEVTIPLGTLGRAQADLDGAVTLHVHTHVREDALELFGFSSTAERTVFRTLLTIPKVGPKLALAILSALSVDELSQIVHQGQPAQLTRVPGVGRKTAERILLELEGKIARGVTTANTAAASSSPLPGSRAQASTLTETLVRMGFKPSEAERAVSTLGDLERPMGELLREALAILAP